MTFRMAFSTVTGIRPATLVIISCSSRRGRDGSRRVFISVSSHFFSCNGILIVNRPNCTLFSCYFESDQWISVLTFWLKYGSGRQYPSIIFPRFSKTLWNTWWSLSPTTGKGSWDGNGSVFGFTWWSRQKINTSHHRWQYVYKWHWPKKLFGLSNMHELHSKMHECIRYRTKLCYIFSQNWLILNSTSFILYCSKSVLGLFFFAIITTSQ